MNMPLKVQSWETLIKIQTEPWKLKSLQLRTLTGTTDETGGVS